MISFILSPELQITLLPFKILFFLLTIFFIGFLVFFLLKTRWLELSFLYPVVEFFDIHIFGSRKAKKRLKKIFKKIDDFEEKDYKKAIIKVDKRLAKVLGELVPFFQTTTSEERLSRLSPVTLPNVEQLQKVHKISKEIRNDPDYKLELEEGRRILSIYEKAFRELEII